MPEPMSAEERLAAIWHKIERANKHIFDLDCAIRAFNERRPNRVSAKRDPETGEPIIYMLEPGLIDPAIPAILGDALHNLRTALDYLAGQLYLVGSGASAFRQETGFYIAPSPSEYERHAGGKVQGMRQEAIDALGALEPYKCGKGHDFWALHRLNNIDKHRALIAVGIWFGSPGRGALITGQSVGLGIKPMIGFWTPNIDRLLKDGYESLASIPKEEFQEDVNFSFSIALCEPEVVKPWPILVTIQHLAQLVSNTVIDFKPLLK
jgi:hypothetical protein